MYFKIFLYSLIIKCVFKIPEGLSDDEVNRMFEFMFAYFRFENTKQLKEYIFKNKIDHDHYPYANVVCIPYMKSDNTYLLILQRVECLKIS